MSHDDNGGVEVGAPTGSTSHAKERAAETLCHQITGMLHLALAHREMMARELMDKLRENNSGVDAPMLEDVLAGIALDLGLRETAEIFFALDMRIKLEMTARKKPAALEPSPPTDNPQNTIPPEQTIDSQQEQRKT